MDKQKIPPCDCDHTEAVLRLLTALVLLAASLVGLVGLF